MLAEACRHVGASSGTLLLLSAETGQLDVAAEWPVSDRSGCSADRTIGEPPSAIHVRTAIDEVVVTAPAVHDDVVIGLLEVRAPVIDDGDVALVDTVAGLISLVRSNQVFTAGLQLVPPIPDVSGDESLFRRRVFEYLDSHTQAAVVAVYLVDPDLDVSLVFGPPPDSDVQSVLDDPVTHERLREVAIDRGRPAVFPCAVSRRHPAPPIASYTLVSRAAPPGPDSPSDRLDEAYVMLVGFPMPYSPCEAEIAVFMQLLALAAYLHQVYGFLHDIAGRVGAVAEIGSAITGLEISQKARHDAKNQIDLAQNLIAQILNRSGGVKKELEELGVILLRVGDDLDEMKRATKAPVKDLVATSLRAMWETACGQIQWRMRQRKIQLRYDGPDAIVLAAPDWFRQVFLNLLLNSADAFDKLERRSGRVTLRVDATSAGSGRVEMSYSDDASGVLPQHFLGCEVAKEIELRERIFLPGVTSKSGGSGWGLYVCRSIIKYHLGSIDLEPSRSGTVFRISIPRAA